MKSFVCTLISITTLCSCSNSSYNKRSPSSLNSIGSQFIDAKAREKEKGLNQEEMKTREKALSVVHKLAQDAGYQDYQIDTSSFTAIYVHTDTVICKYLPKGTILDHSGMTIQIRNNKRDRLDCVKR